MNYAVVIFNLTDGRLHELHHFDTKQEADDFAHFATLGDVVIDDSIPDRIHYVNKHFMRVFILEVVKV